MTARKGQGEPWGVPADTFVWFDVASSGQIRTLLGFAAGRVRELGDSGAWLWPEIAGLAVPSDLGELTDEELEELRAALQKSHDRIGGELVRRAAEGPRVRLGGHALEYERRPGQFRFDAFDDQTLGDVAVDVAVGAAAAGYCADSAEPCTLITITRDEPGHATLEVRIPRSEARAFAQTVLDRSGGGDR